VLLNLQQSNQQLSVYSICTTCEVS